MEFVAAALAVFGIFSGKKAADAQEDAANKAAREEARLEGIVTAEKIRRLNVEERALSGETKAIAAGSGVKATRGAVRGILAEQASEFDKERQIVRTVGASRAATALQRVSNVGTMAQLAFRTNAFNSASNIFQMLGARE